MWDNLLWKWGFFPTNDVDVKRWIWGCLIGVWDCAFFVIDEFCCRLNCTSNRSILPNLTLHLCDHIFHLFIEIWLNLSMIFQSIKLVILNCPTIPRKELEKSENGWESVRLPFLFHDRNLGRFQLHHKHHLCLHNSDKSHQGFHVLRCNHKQSTEFQKSSSLVSNWSELAATGRWSVQWDSKSSYVRITLMLQLKPNYCDST